jgi:hypothetical protein
VAKKKATTRKTRAGSKTKKTARKATRTGTSASRSRSGSATKRKKVSSRKTSSRKANGSRSTTRKTSSSKASSSGRKSPKKKVASRKAATRKTSSSRKATPRKTTVSRKVTRRKSSNGAGKRTIAAVAAVEQGATGPGPRMLQVLQAEMITWDRDNLSHEDSQLQELDEIPVRNMYGAEEARRRLLDRQTVSPAKRRLRSRTTSSS